MFKTTQRSSTIASGSTARSSRARTAALSVAAIIVCGALATTALAVLTQSTGATQIRMDNRGETAPAPAPGIAWTDLPGSDVPINIQESRLINARFTAESKCTGPDAGTCVVRIIAVNQAGTTALDPNSGVDFAFDTAVPGAADDGAEAHAMERSRRLPPGNYIIRVQYAVTNANTTFMVDDRHVAVETSA